MSIELPYGRMDQLPDHFAVDPFDHVVSSQDTVCKTVLEAWIRGWPAVSEWKFDASIIGDGSIQVSSTRITADGRVWASRDIISRVELDYAHDITKIVELRARARFDEFQAASAALTKEAA